MSHRRGVGGRRQLEVRSPEEDHIHRVERRRQTLFVSLLFVGLTAMMTWPQVLHMATRARDHQDVYFNMWRLRWVAHALATDPTRLFDANIFHPEQRTLTF